MTHKAYEFQRRNGYWFTKKLVDTLWSSRGVVRVSLDLGISWVEVKIHGDNVIIDDDVINLGDVVPSEHDRVVFLDKNTHKAYEVTRRDKGGFYKLKIIDPYKAPTVEINGIHMHRITRVDPWRDSRIKIVEAKIRPGHKVLDTCMGLGYTAIQSILRGAKLVVTIEVDENVVWIAEHNPWSHGLSSDKIRIIIGDVVKVLDEFPDEYFDRILHDPPRFSRSTGILYGLSFYKKLYRVLKPGGILYHYTGSPKIHSGSRLIRGIGERLRKAGFHPVIYKPRAQGYIGYKPLL